MEFEQDIRRAEQIGWGISYIWAAVVMGESFWGRLGSWSTVIWDDSGAGLNFVAFLLAMV